MDRRFLPIEFVLFAWPRHEGQRQVNAELDVPYDRSKNAETVIQRYFIRATLLDQLEVWNKDTTHAFAGRFDLNRVGMSGHSFGAVTTQAVSGQKYPIGMGFTDSRIKAAVIMSPSGPANGNTKQAFGSVKIPWMLLTGTKDSNPINGADAKTRLTVFPDLAPGSKYQLVLDNAEHSAFGDRALPGETERRNPNHHRAMLAVTTAFWDAYLRQDKEARQWLDSDAVQCVLEKDDKWQKK